MQDKKEQRDLVQCTVNAKSLTLLRLLVDELKLSCSGCHLHSIVTEAPLDLLVTLMKLAGSLNARHPELKSNLIHKVHSHIFVPSDAIWTNSISGSCTVAAVAVAAAMRTVLLCRSYPVQLSAS